MINPVVDLGIPESVGGMQNVQTLGRINAVIKARKAPFYRGRLDHINVDHVSRPEEWAKIPILEMSAMKTMGQEAFLQAFCVSERKDIVEFWRSDDTGLLFPRTSRDQRYAMVGVKRALVLGGLGEDDLTHLSLPMGMDPTGHLMAQSATEIGIAMVCCGAEDLSAQLDLVRLLQPSAWIGRVSTGLALAQLAANQKVDLVIDGVRRMLCTGEALSDETRRSLSQKWGAEVRDCLALSELMMLGCEDAECYGFRFWSDYCYPEILDPQTMEQVEEGVAGMLVLTPLVTNHATPFLRMNTGRMATMRSGSRLRTAFDVFPVIQLVG
ncbi:hypothetical protein OS190_16775 [Sulfitobacter sp. F26204]|uniref:phenylacetate--CoA ligase family protein n=1 Tax=Sulfitobacter sp. F26204 TaxID=2996014 RepID=UPI00225E5E2C|nr:hypothetical protein [Sulfitobacter sp. F26204]MCX7561224.1 hypothetical protein [Sulfitobacter sp. F26204]